MSWNFILRLDREMYKNSLFIPIGPDFVDIDLKKCRYKHLLECEKVKFGAEQGALIIALFHITAYHHV